MFSDRLYVDQLQLGKVFDLKSNFSEENIKSLEASLFPRKAARGVSRNVEKDLYFPFLSK